jgi:hypothetical protein
MRSHDKPHSQALPIEEAQNKEERVVEDPGIALTAYSNSGETKAYAAYFHAPHHPMIQALDENIIRTWCSDYSI